MAKPFDGKKPMETDLSGKSVEDLLFLIGDQDLGFKLEAMKVLVSRGFQANYPLLERAIRNDSDADLRNGAMEVLVRFGVEAVPALIEILHDENEEVRNFSAVMLGTIGSRQAVYPLIAALRDPDVNVSHAAAEALGKIGDDAALLPLIQLLQEDFWLQYPAVVAMGEMADDRAVPHLISLLDNELLRQPVITALGKIGHCSALPSLVEILCDNGGQFVAVAATAIADIVAHGDHVVKDELAATIDKRGIENLLRLASSKNCESKGGAVTLLGFLGEKSAIPVLLSLLEDNDYEDVAKKAITEMAVATPVLMEALHCHSQKIQGVVLGLLRNLQGEVPVDQLLCLFHQGSPEVQQEVIASLAGATDPEIFPVVEQLLENGTVGSCMTELAAKALSRFSPDYIGPLCRRLFESNDPQKRAVAALFAGYAEAEALSKFLSALFSDSDVCVRKEAVKAAGRWKKREHLPLLVSALADPDSSVRAEALFSLAEFREEAPLSQILQQLGTQDERLDYEIIMAMGRIGRAEAEDTLASYINSGGISRHLEFAVIETLGKIGSSKGAAGQTVAHYLLNADPDIRRLAVEALASLGAEDFVEEIIVACRDQHWSVRVAALQELGRLGSDRLIPAIAAALHDEDHLVKKNAISALARSGNALAVAELVKWVADPVLGKYAAAALTEVGRDHLSLLHRLAASTEPSPMRQGIITILGKLGDEGSMKTLVSLVKTDPVAEIRTAATYALILSGGQTGE